MKKTYPFALLLLAIGLLKLFPHAPNFTPIFALLAITLNSAISRVWVGITLLTALLLFDALLSFKMGYPLLGSWMLFSYSGYLAITALAGRFRTSHQTVSLLCSTGLSACFYWLWTNGGVWLMDGIYPLDQTGFVTCYTLALPFLYSSLLSNFIGVLIYSAIQYLKASTASQTQQAF